jgi:selenocysteine-specific elongation factor
VDIVRLLGIHEAIVVLTKTDLVDPEWLALVRADVARFFEGTPFAEAPVLGFSSKTGEGRDALLAAIDAKLAAARPVGRGDVTRLPVDRVFVLEGFGTVVTGTLWGGAVRAGDEVTVLPRGTRTRVRSVQVHGRKVESAGPGHRVAVALHGLARDDLARGDWIAGPGPLAASSMLDARLALLGDAAKPLRNNARVRFHHGASELLGRVLLLEGDELAPGASMFAQVRLEAPAVALRGDRFVIRRYSPPRAIGGGVLLDPVASKRRRGDARAIESLRVLERGDPRAQVEQAVRSRGAGGLHPRDLGKALGGAADEAFGSAAEGLAAAGVLRALPDGTLVHREAVERACALLLEEVAAHQRDHAIRWGMVKGELKSRLARQVPGPLFDLLLAEETAAGRLHQRGDRVRAGDAGSALGAAEEAFRDRVETILKAQPFAPPAPKEILAAAPGMEAGALTEMLQHLVFEGRAVRVTSDLFYHADAVRALMERLREFFAAKEELGVGDFKDLFGLSRKHAVPLLEHLDRTGMTRRRGDVRIAGPGLAGEGPAPGDGAAAGGRD